MLIFLAPKPQQLQNEALEQSGVMKLSHLN